MWYAFSCHNRRIDANNEFYVINWICSMSMYAQVKFNHKTMSRLLESWNDWREIVTLMQHCKIPNNRQQKSYSSLSLAISFHSFHLFCTKNRINRQQTQIKKRRTRIRTKLARFCRRSHKIEQTSKTEKDRKCVRILCWTTTTTTKHISVLFVSSPFGHSGKFKQKAKMKIEKSCIWEPHKPQAQAQPSA